MALALPILVKTSLFARPYLAMVLPRYLNDSTSAIGFSSSNIGVLHVVLVLRISNGLHLANLLASFCRFCC